MIRSAGGRGLTFSLAASLEEAPEAIASARGRGLGLEIALFETAAYLDSPASLEKLGADARGGAKSRPVPLSAHGPIYDLNPGSPEPVVRDFTVRAMSAAVRATRTLGADRMVIHSGFNPLLPRECEDPWSESAASALRTVVGAARESGLRLLLENSFEESPETLVRLAEAIDPSGAGDVGFCFDLAHARLRSNLSFSEWLAALSPRVAEFHLNDCDGKDDLHLALGDGVCEVIPFLETVAGGTLRETPIVLEMPIERAEKSLAYLAARGFRPNGA